MDPRTRKRWQAAIRGNEVEEIRKLISDGVDVNEPIEGAPPLCLAAMFGRFEAAKLLVDSGADVNQTTQPPKGAKPGFVVGLDSPLILAAGTGNARLVKMLLDQGADVAYQSATHGDALSHAIVVADTRSYLDLIRVFL
jgi:ankyrin repeat protein